MDKDQRLSVGRVEAEDRKLDFEESLDDEEVTLLLPRKGADERDLPGADIRDVPEVSGTQREDWVHMEPLHEARPKCNRAGRPTVVPEEPRGLEVEATGGMDGLDVEEHGALAPPLSLPWWDMQEAGVITSPRREVNGHGGLRAPGSRLPPRGTRVAPHIFTEARDKDVASELPMVPSEHFDRHGGSLTARFGGNQG